MEQLDDLVNEFLVESAENLDQLDRDLVAIEQAPDNPELLSRIFRCIHTIKGTCGFLAYAKLERVAHVGESLLALLREGTLPLTAERTTALLATVDAIRGMLASVGETGTDGEEDHAALIARLEQLQQIPGVGSMVAAAVPIHGTVPIALRDPTSQPIENGTPRPPMLVMPETPLVAANSVASLDGDPRPLSDDGGKASIRVDVGLLDRLMNLVGELVLARNQVLRFASDLEDPMAKRTTQRLNLITVELQEGVMKTRMQPIGSVWSKFPRVVRDVAAACQKQVRIEMDGKETELDKTIIEAIKDPLTHIVRNSVDHGIESPEVRVARGKPAEGVLLLRAYHEGGQVNIEISDDGAGIDAEKLKSKALHSGAITAEQAAKMSEREALRLVFLPGLSTADTVSNISGRGVGMDVVRTNIERIGGVVDVQSKVGSGTTLRIKIPLTLAIIPALIVTSRDERFAIPQVNLLELVRLEGEQARKSIERLHGTTLYRLRGHLLPLVFLDRALELGEPAAADDVFNIVVLQADDRQFGLVVDGISDTEEIVVKPLGKELKGISAFAGATIMGDGRVALILDVLGIAQRANVVSVARERAIVNKNGPARDEGNAHETLLLFRVGKTGRMAIPLSMVARLEEVARTHVEQAAGRDVVQYRGAILPLLDLGREIAGEPTDLTADSPLQVIVYSEHGRSVGFVVEQILDIVEQPVTVSHRTPRPGVLGAAVVQGKVTDLLDVHGVIRRHDPSFFDRETAA